MHLLDDGDLSLMALRAQARQIAVRDGRLGLVVVDYLQLMRVERPSGSRVEDVSEFSRGLKRLARELDCPVIAVAQLSRAVEQRPDKRPVLADLRESGQIEADADCVLMLYREDYYDPDSERPGEMDIIVRKNRQGRLGQATTRHRPKPAVRACPSPRNQVTLYPIGASAAHSYVSLYRVVIDSITRMSGRLQP